MPKLEFEEAKRKFGSGEDAAEYFLLVELCEKHLQESQKDSFLNAKTIDDMLDVLDDKQLQYIKSLISVYTRNRYIESSDDFKNEAFSDWFKHNMIESSRDADTIALLDRIHEKLKRKKDIGALKAEYISRLKKFDGNSVEYRKWLVLLYIDDTIPNITKCYNIAKLLKQLDLERLKELREKIGKNIVAGKYQNLVASMKYLEPYYYWCATSGVRYSTANPLDAMLGSAEDHFIKNTTFREEFNDAISRLISDIRDMIEEKQKEKRELVELKIEALVRSKRFEQDILEIARSTLGADDVLLKKAIGKYSKAGSYGTNFNGYLRKTALLKKLKDEVEKKNKNSTSETIQFRNEIAKVYEYFKNHLISKEYTVYRGEGPEGLAALLDTICPPIDYKKTGNIPIITNSLIEEINKRQPVVTTEGLTSTSLNKGESAVSFRGKKYGNIFFTIKLPRGSKALVLDYEQIENVPAEEEVLLAPKTKIKINSMEKVNDHYEIEAAVIN